MGRTTMAREGIPRGEAAATRQERTELVRTGGTPWRAEVAGLGQLQPSPNSGPRRREFWRQGLWPVVAEASPVPNHGTKVAAAAEGSHRRQDTELRRAEPGAPRERGEPQRGAHGGSHRRKPGKPRRPRDLGPQPRPVVAGPSCGEEDTF